MSPATTTAIDLGDLQGDVLRGYGNRYGHVSYAFVHLGCPAEQARRWLDDVVDHVTTASPWPSGHRPATTLNVAFTTPGLRALGVPEALLGTFSSEFRHGMAARAPILGDVGPSAPEHWQPGLGGRDAHVLLTINALSAADHVHALQRMRDAMADVDGIAVVGQQDAELLPGAREHFGFADGASQPALEDADPDRIRGGGVPVADGDWRGLAPGEFVLGLPDEDTRAGGPLPSAPGGVLGRHGTYVVWRKLYQDVARFRRVLHDAAHGDDAEAARLAAKVVGRWHDGAPLVTHPDAPPDHFDPRSPAANDFRYAADLDGHGCPVGAHVRRANPRDALGFDGHLSFRHRMIRRGMPYGPPLPDGVMVDDGVDRGLVFVCFQASISRQFEGVQVQWLNDGNIFGLGHDRDFLLGSPTGRGKMTIEGDPPVFLSPQQPFVRLRGGAYLFMPGMTALAALADGTTG